MKEKIGMYLYFIMLIFGTLFSLLNEIGIEISKNNNLLYSFYVAIVIISFTLSPMKLSYINDLKIKSKNKLWINFLTNIGEFIPVYFIVINSTAIYSSTGTEVFISRAASIIGLIFFGMIYSVFNYEDAKNYFDDNAPS
ncbi:hypothetical protein L1U14_000577 [Enterococcus faecalis]|nr:hypothetical protein [Enterococcus faecalis]